MKKPDPNWVAQFAHLEKLSVFDAQIGLKILGKDSFVEMLRFLIQVSIPEDKIQLAQAYKTKNWQEIINIAHRMHSGALYCGTVRIQKICEYLELQGKSHCAASDYLYKLLLKEIDASTCSIRRWLEKNS